MNLAVVILLGQALAPPLLSPTAVVPPPPVAAPAHPTVASRRSGHPRSATPVGNPGDWVKRKDYPSAAMFAQREGIVGFLVVVDRKGRVSSCEVTSRSRWLDLDAATCELVTKRARFRPATDAKGKATVGSYSGRVRWMIPPITIDL